MKKYLFMGLSLALCVAMAITGTLAYLQDSDSDVNVMTLGEVDIEQLQYERVVENGAWVSTGETDKYGYTPDKLQAFTQNKPLYPAVFTDGAIKWDDRNGSENATGAGSHQQSWGQVGASGSNQLFDDSVKNVIDNFTFVKNNGINGAYVRTWFAFEQGEIAADNFKNVIMTNSNKDHWSWETVATDVQIDGNEYYVMCATYLGPKSNPTGVLASGATTYPSLLQIYMKPEATNEDVQAIDGNDNGLYDVLVVSQAVQVDGFANAETALNAAFGDATDKTHPWNGEAIDTEVEFRAALKAGGNIKLAGDIFGDYAESFEVPAGVTVTLDLNGKTIENSIAGKPALVNNGALTINGEGAIVNGTSNVAKSHTVRNYGDLTINGGNIGTFATSGAAVVNDGNAVINGGNFASRQESNAQYGQGPAAYSFINNGAGTMIVNDATMNGPTHGIFAAYNGKLIVNGGNYTLQGNNGMGCYVVYATGGGKVYLNGGIVNTNEPRHGRYFYVYDNGNYFNADAVTQGSVVVAGVTLYKDGSKIYPKAPVEVKTLTDFNSAVANAKNGDTIVLAEDITFTGNDYPNLTKAITLDLNGKKLTTTSYGVIAKGGCSIINGTIVNPVGSRAAIRVLDSVNKIENVVIEAPLNGGISISSGNYSVGMIKDVTIKSATYGIESYRNTVDTIGVMDNVKIDAGQYGILLNGAGKIGSISNCEIKGDEIGVNAYLANLWHISLKFENSKVIGGTSGIDVWDEAATNTGSTVTLDYDDATVFEGATNDIKVTLQKEISCTINGVKQTTPCDLRISD